MKKLYVIFALKAKRNTFIPSNVMSVAAFVTRICHLRHYDKRNC